MLVAKTSIEFINLGIKFKNLSDGINIGGFHLAFYGIIIGMGMILGTLLACLEAKRTNQNPDDYTDFALYAIILCVIGARAYYVLFRWDYYSKNLSEIVNIRKGGLAIYGGIITGVIFGIIYTRIKKKSFKLMADTACLGLVLGQIIGRWGNFFNREAFGGVATDKSLFAMRIYFDDWYSSSQVPEAVAKGMYEMTGKTIQHLGYIQVQPTFLYESLWNLCLLIFILIIGKKKKFDGQVFLTYVLGYGLGRVWIEVLRTDQLLIPVINFPVSQALSAVLIIVSGGFLIYGFIKIKNNNMEDNNNLEKSKTDGEEDKTAQKAKN